MENLNDILGKITEFLKSELKTETLIGQQFQLGAFTCVPVIAAGMGFGGGGGEGTAPAKDNATGEGTGAGAGAGMGIAPVGFLVTKGDDIQFISTRQSKGLGAVLEKMPDVLEKFLDKKKDGVHA